MGVNLKGNRQESWSECDQNTLYKILKELVKTIINFLKRKRQLDKDSITRQSTLSK